MENAREVKIYFGAMMPPDDIGWLGQIVSVYPGMNMRITLP